MEPIQDDRRGRQSSVFKGPDGWMPGDSEPAEPIQDDPKCPTCGLTYWKNLCRDPFHGEPIQDDSAEGNGASVIQEVALDKEPIQDDRRGKQSSVFKGPDGWMPGDPEPAEPIQDDRPRNFMEEGTWNMSSREPIQDDQETVRECLTQLVKDAAYAESAGYGGEYVRVYQGNTALAALDRLVAERDRLKDEVEQGWDERDQKWRDSNRELVAERDRLVEGIGALVEKWRESGVTSNTLYAGDERVAVTSRRGCADELEALTKATEEPDINAELERARFGYAGEDV